MSRLFSTPTSSLTSRFVVTVLVSSLALVVTGCNKKPTGSTTNAASSTSSTTTTTSSTTVTTADSSVAGLAVDSATSATALTTASSAAAATSATAATSAPAATQIQGNPKDTVKNHIEALRTGNVKNAVSYVQTNDPKAISQFLTQNIPQYKNLKSVKYDEPQYNQDKTQAQVIATFSGKTMPQPLKVPYLLVGTPTGWKILADAPPKNTPATGKDGKVQTNLMTANEAAALKASNGKNGVPQIDKNGKVVANLQPSGKSAVPQKPRTAPIVADTTKKGTPEDTVKQAMNTLVTGTTKEATKFYISKNPKLTDVVAQQQVLFQQNLQAVKLGEVKYNKNKTQADVNVLLVPFAPEPVPVKNAKANKSSKAGKKPTDKAQPQPAPQPQAGVIKLEKKGGVWKILAD